MTRWERMLEVLGLTEREFELEKARFDSSPRDWVRERIQFLVGEPDDLIPEVVHEKCERACCMEVR